MRFIDNIWSALAGAIVYNAALKGDWFWAVVFIVLIVLNAYISEARD